MQCMKCGKSTEENQVFCESCLQVMDAYPVKPDTAIHLPNRNLKYPYKKPSRKKAIPPEEQISRLKRALRRTRLISAILILLLSLVLAFSIYHLSKPEVKNTQEKAQQFTYNQEESK